MKIALAQLNFHTGNFKQNTDKIIDAIRKTKGQADLIVFSELAICGYPPRDFLEFSDFLRLVNDSLERVKEASSSIGVIVGLPTLNKVGKGKPLHNSAAFIAGGELKAIRHKSLLPTYDIFDEYRYFEPAQENSCIEFKGKKIALTICEDLWNLRDNPLYSHNPMDQLANEKPDLMINIAASPFSEVQRKEREKVLSDNARHYGIPLVYVNHVGAQTELIFDGDSAVYKATGAPCLKLPLFEESIEVVDLNDLENIPKPAKEESSEIAQIEKALVLGVRDYFSKLGFKKAVLGLSGGIDSAVVCVLAVKALGAENVLPVLLPSRFTASASNSEAIKLAQNLGCQHEIISIESVFDEFKQTLSPLFKRLPEGLAEENLQARTRGTLLMGLSNKLGYILLNTTNKSEMAVGYGTLYGDLCGGLSVIGDLYKGQVYELARFMNREEEIIPSFIIDRPPSAELRENQQDTDSLPPYDELDELLKQYIEGRKSPEELREMGFEESTIKRVLSLVNSSEWKRYQTAPILRVSPKAFGMGRRMPIVAKYLS